MIQTESPVTLNGHYVRLRSIDWERKAGDIPGLDLVELSQLYAQPENEWRICHGQTMNLESTEQLLFTDVWQQKIISPMGSDKVIGHMTGYKLDLLQNHIRLSMAIDKAHPLASEGVALFIDLLFDYLPNLRFVMIEAPEYNAQQFMGKFAKELIGELTPVRGYYEAPIKSDLVFGQLWRETWIASGYPHGGYLSEMERAEAR